MASPLDFEAIVLHWSQQLDALCADLERQGFGVERDGLSVRVIAPGTDDKPRCFPPCPPAGVHCDFCGTDRGCGAE